MVSGEILSQPSTTARLLLSFTSSPALASLLGLPPSVVDLARSLASGFAGLTDTVSDTLASSLPFKLPFGFPFGAPAGIASTYGRDNREISTQFTSSSSSSSSPSEATEVLLALERLTAAEDEQLRATSRELLARVTARFLVRLQALD